MDKVDSPDYLDAIDPRQYPLSLESLGFLDLLNHLNLLSSILSTSLNRS